ncbi:ABC transporter ATP-binding protein [Sporomusa sp. KB1]|jgi:NitT/TauT family transport system ATP-binding protein|uniref:ABC transporter ATP-binding protein n=1 Tax=Sporomusa sp. KB1 TaxID=943346 RepID=UPI00119D773C|nr:ABC transporter ATP-binding protein [Sporomusa sp. KB1]TWH49313.1 NitT/TauT family transport system ATP-binding protein [Sporomusa sp. KB1]
MPYDSTSIVLHHIGKVFVNARGQVTALTDINISIGDGEFFSIVGPSGCGKTTLLRILAGLDTASSGTVTIKVTTDDRPINSMVFQEQSIFPWLTVMDNVAYGLKLRGISKKERYQIAEKYIRMIGLTKFAKAYPHQLSGGMKQRVSVARAFANDPEILLMDEPFGALDEQNRILLQQELLRIWDVSKKTTVFITHSIDEALCLSDRILIMTAHPGTVKSIVNVDLPRPRDIAAIRTTMRYNELFQSIWLTLREEVLKVKDRECADN